MRPVTFALTALLPALAATTAAAQRPIPAPPRLLVFITVDQMRADYLDRWAPQYTGGLARLRRGGADFTNAFQDHAVTETAPGHATVLSGREPWKTGIVKNSAGVNDPQAALIGVSGGGASPFRFRGTTLIDWMRTADPASRALSVSRKDRGAILPIGRAKQPAYWYAPNGTFTTSTYYGDTLPGWVRDFNARREPQGYAGGSWTLLLPQSAYAEKDSVPVENGGREVTFPHALPADPGSAAAQLAEYPFMDDVTVHLALQGLETLRLGATGHTDLLAVSLSTTDAIGHRYGPDSREMHDQILRLDRLLGTFIDSIYRLRDSSTVVIALTGDHGMTSYPEVVAATPAAAAAMHVDLTPLVRTTTGALAAHGLPAGAFDFEDGVLSVDRRAFTQAGLDADSVVRAFAAAIRTRPGVARVDLVADLSRADTLKDPIARRWLHQIPPDVPIPLVVTLRRGYIWGTRASAEHGSPSDDDAHVPVVFYGPGFAPGRYTAFARVVDMAPTLAAVIGVRPTEPIDGRILTRALRRPVTVITPR
jgi:predicted AlkP superfamily pyrophosphatase or phosphodiesterase